MVALREALAGFDGRDTDVLAAIRDSETPDGRTLRQCIDLLEDGDERIAIGASWLLRAWLEAGSSLTAAQYRRFAGLLPRLTNHHVRLHVFQAGRTLRIPSNERAAFAAFFTAGAASERPFLRAWATDALHRLGQADARYVAAARAALEAGLDDPAAAVRARVRRIMRGE